MIFERLSRFHKDMVFCRDESWYCLHRHHKKTVLVKKEVMECKQ